MKLVFATNNIHKVEEIRHLLGGRFELMSLSDIGWSEDIPENHPTLEGNASEKAWFVVNQFMIDAFADDTGLEIDRLNGAPGVHSARFAGKNKNANENMNKVLDLLRGVKNRKAQFRTVISLVMDRQEFFFEGIVRGLILEERRGILGFGYDPIFLPDGYTRTFAEMSLEEKNRISHRAIAFRKLVDYLRSQ